MKKLYIFMKFGCVFSIFLTGCISSEQVVIVGIIPRLDENDQCVPIYNGVFREVATKSQSEFLEVDEYFADADRKYWSFRDSIHISEDFGLPLLCRLIREHSKTRKPHIPLETDNRPYAYMLERLKRSTAQKRVAAEHCFAGEFAKIKYISYMKRSQTKPNHTA